MISPYISFPVESLRLDTTIDFDLYLKHGDNYVMYQEANLPFNKETKQKLIDNNTKEIFIRRTNKKKFFSYIENNIDQIIQDKTISVEKKTETLYGTSKELVIDIFTNPGTSNNIKRSIKIISSSLGLIFSEKSSIGYLYKITAYDYSTYTHSLNVSLYSISLADKLNIFSKKEINELGLGAMLHDIGKTKISDDIINKNGPLTEEEYAQIKKHPVYGNAILKKTDIIPEKSYLPVIEHQEKGDGSGYPKGLKLKDISPFGKITAICDVFDALTTQKPYKPALSTFNALKLMHELKNQFDPHIFKRFIFLMSEKK